MSGRNRGASSSPQVITSSSNAILSKTIKPKNNAYLPLTSSQPQFPQSSQFSQYSQPQSQPHLFKVELVRDEQNQTFGFNIKGGAEFRRPIYIHRVEQGSLAEAKGLRKGQEIVEVNGVPLRHVSHPQALQVIKGQPHLQLILQATPNPHSQPFFSNFQTPNQTPQNFQNPKNFQNFQGLQRVNSCSSSASASSVKGPLPQPPLLNRGIRGGSLRGNHTHPTTPTATSSYPNQRPSSALSSFPVNSSAFSNIPSTSTVSSAQGGRRRMSIPTMASSYTWIDARGHPVPPPTPTTTASSTSLLAKRIINIEINPGQNLGLMIRGGCEYGLGIYVTGVDLGSVAQRAGLQRGDEILEVNGRNFTQITHDKAVQILKSCRKMSIVANYIGKIPADNQMQGMTLSGASGGQGPGGQGQGGIENTELIDLGQSSGAGTKLLTTSMGESSLISHGHHSLHNHNHNILMDSTNVTLFEDEVEDQDLLAEEEKLDQTLELDFANSDADNRLFHQDLEKSTSIMGMIEEKARTVLTKSEHSRFTFYRLEYQQGFLPIQTFVRILLELLNTVEKYTLLTEVREIVRPADVSSFDELIYNKEQGSGSLLGIKKMGVVGGGGGPSNYSMQMANDPNMQLISMGGGDQMLGSSNGNIAANISGQGQIGIGAPGVNNMNVGRRISPNSMYNQQQLYNETTFSTPTNAIGVGGSQAENNRQLLITRGDAQNVAVKLQQQKVQQGFVGGMQGIGNQTPIAPNSCVRYKIRVQKTKPILGIAIEGGANTPHRLPRVIDVNTEGSAYGSQLKPGQVLLTVDGKKLDGLSHEEVARSILDSYVDMSKPLIEFVVVEAKSSFVQSQQQQQLLLTAPIPPPPGQGQGQLQLQGLQGQGLNQLQAQGLNQFQQGQMQMQMQMGLPQNG